MILLTLGIREGVRTYVIANETKSCVFGVLFHDSSERCLCVSGHGVSFVQDDDFAIVIAFYWGSSLGEPFDGVSDNLDTSCIGGVELEYHHAVLSTVHLLGTCDHCRGLTCSRRTVEKQIWQAIFLDECSD